MRTVYLINLSFGLAGIERRFANIWQALKRRRNVRAIMVVPDTLADILAEAELVDRNDELLWTVPEPSWLRTLGGIPLPQPAEMFKAFGRARVLAKRYESVWTQIAADDSAVVHMGMNCSSMNPTDVPLVYECVDATLSQLGTRYYVKATSRPCIVNCQTERIREALERTMAHRSTKWVTVSSPCYFGTYRAECPLVRPHGPPVVAFVGRLAAAKNPYLFLDALAAVRERGVEVRALMLGEGPESAGVHRRIQQLRLTDIVHVEFSHNSIDRLAEVSIFVSLTSGDNYGSQSLVEAMGAGCAIVATNVGETGRLVTPDVGVLVDEDPVDVARGIAELASQPERMATMGVAAASKVRTEYSADAYVGFLESLYERAAAAHQSYRASARASKAPIAESGTL